jgi:hypothetical protein
MSYSPFFVSVTLWQNLGAGTEEKLSSMRAAGSSKMCSNSAHLQGVRT